MNTEPGDYIVGFMMAVFGLIGLFLASGATDDEIYVFGLSLAGFAFLFVLGLIRRVFDRRDQARALAREVEHV